MKHRDLSETSSYELMHTEEMRSIKAPIHIIEGFLPSGGVMGLTSYPGVGKTWLTMEVMRAITTGKPFLNRFPVNIPGAVLFVGNDASVYDYARQWSRLTSEISNEELKHAWFLCQSGFMLDDDEEVSRLIKTSLEYVVEKDVLTEMEDEETGEMYSHRADRTNFEVIIFDTLSRLCRANQNDNTEMEEVFRNVRDIAEATGAAIILLHHNSKPNEHNEGTDWRGAMSQIGALDSWVQLTRQKQSKADAILTTGSYLVSAQFKKFRGITPDDFGFRMEVGNPDNATLIASDEPITLADELTQGKLALDIRKTIEMQPHLPAIAYRNALYTKYADDFKTRRTFDKAVENRIAACVKKELIVKTRNDGETTYSIVIQPEVM